MPLLLFLGVNAFLLAGLLQMSISPASSTMELLVLAGTWYSQNCLEISTSAKEVMFSVSFPLASVALLPSLAFSFRVCAVLGSQCLCILM